MRIITGSAKGMTIETIQGESTRPTAEKVKEALFSMIQFDIEGRRVLDLFAGSGQLGLEALSRGAEHCFFVDSSRECTEVIRRNVKKTRMVEQSRIMTWDYTEFFAKKTKDDKFDLVFLDPPYAAKLLPDSLRRLKKSELLKPTSLIICESGHTEIFETDKELASQYEIIKQSKYSGVYVTLLKLAEVTA